jgi:hypothetical protein
MPRFDTYVEITMSNKSNGDTKRSINVDKARKKKNALVHGVYARDIVLPWESREDFEKLHADLRAEFDPHGTMEQETVLDLACLRWQKQRVRKMWHAAAYNDPFIMDLVESRKKSWSGIRRYLRREAKNSQSLTGSLHESFSHFADQAGELGRSLGEEGQGEAEVANTQRQIEAIFQTLNQHILPLLRDLEAGPNAERTLGQAYSPAYLEPILRLEAMIDARIDKALGRLVNLKEYKRLSSASAVHLPPMLGRSPREMQSQINN